jgi:hypothetical protein
MPIDIAHTHTYQLTRYILLGLPSIDDHAERYIAYRCACGRVLHWTCTWPLGRPLGGPAVLRQARAQERASGSAESQMAQRQEGMRRRW